MSEEYFKPSRTSVIEHFLRKYLTALAVNYFHKKAPSWMFEQVLITPLNVSIEILRKPI